MSRADELLDGGNRSVKPRVRRAEVSPSFVISPLHIVNVDD